MFECAMYNSVAAERSFSLYSDVLRLMRVVVLLPYTKFEVRQTCRSEDMTHDVCQH